MSASKSKKKQTSTLCAWIREHRKASWLIGACAALLILVLILNALDLFYFLDGRLRYFNGKVYGTQENDIVSRVGAARDNRFCISASSTRPPSTPWTNSSSATSTTTSTAGPTKTTATAASF